MINRLRKAAAKVEGIALFGQARQDVQIERHRGDPYRSQASGARSH
ncbi:hypothetical protein [Mesorhizobium sp. dw_380]|nr:hypothetical protein [Mesorhizobium sp. dw_380]